MARKPKAIRTLSDLTPDSANANKGTERGRYLVEASLTETGAGRSIVADKDGRIIAGNKTLEAWAGMGGAVKVVETDGHELVVVQRTDLDLSDPKGKARKLAYYDNRAGQVGLEWDAEQLLADVNAGVDLAAMFKADEIAELLAGVKGGDADAEPQIDQAEELNKKWQVKPGDLWRIGAHRLLCGDSTKAADVARVMGGERAAAVVTDPPYGINVDTGWLSALNVERGKPANKSDAKLANDDGTLDLSDVFSRKEWLVFGFPFIGRSEPYTGLLVWDKRGDGGEGGLGNPVEVAVSNAFNGYRLSRHPWAGYIREAGEKRQPHTTQKPVGIMADAIKLVKGETIYEPFAGSGTTLVACENLGRKCRAIEIASPYCAVILERMAQAFPKLEITRDDGAG